MAPPVTKKRKFSSADNRRLISSSSTAAIGERHEQQQQQSMGSLVTSFGKRRSLRVATKMNRTLRTIWICNDVLMDILPFFGHAQLGLKLALLSPRFNALVDKHFDGKSELTIWRETIIHKDAGPVPKLSALIDGKFVQFPWPDHSLPNRIRFKHLRIDGEFPTKPIHPFIQLHSLPLFLSPIGRIFILLYNKNNSRWSEQQRPGQGHQQREHGASKSIVEMPRKRVPQLDELDIYAMRWDGRSA